MMRLQHHSRTNPDLRPMAAAVRAAAMAALLASSSALAAEFTLTPGAVTPAGAGNVILAVAVQHPDGQAAVKTVAAEVTGANVYATYPTLHDDGTNGDLAAGDGLYSLSVDLPGPAGERTVTYYAVDQAGLEVVTDPAAFTAE